MQALTWVHRASSAWNGLRVPLLVIYPRMRWSRKSMCADRGTKRCVLNPHREERATCRHNQRVSGIVPRHHYVAGVWDTQGEPDEWSFRAENTGTHAANGAESSSCLLTVRSEKRGEESASAELLTILCMQWMREDMLIHNSPLEQVRAVDLPTNDRLESPAGIHRDRTTAW